MRLSLIRAGVAFAAGAFALSACAGQRGVVPPSQSAFAPQTSESAPMQGDAISPLAVNTCATSPPQYQWIFEGACTEIVLKPAGGTFALQTYEGITVTGLIGKNNVKTSAKVDLADATGNGDIKTYKGKPFPKYKAKGTTFVYATAVNQSGTTIKPVPVKNKPILQYVITDRKGIPGKQCGAAVLTNKGWTSLPIQAQVKGKTVTVSQYLAPPGFEFPPKIPLYFAVNCFS